MDGDGDMDVLSASSNDEIAWYKNDGSQNFTPYSISTAADAARSVFAADVDGDGDLDVLSASSSDDKIAWYENLNDTAGFTIAETGGGTTVSETGTTDTFTVVLDAAPLSNVVIAVTSNDTGEATVDRASLTFTPANWDTAQTVTVTGVDDSIVDGAQTSSVTLSIDAANSDDAFDLLADQTVSVATTDDDSNYDFGDAPSPYPTLLANNGARHLATGPTLGSNRDAEIDGQPDPNALGDDNNGTPDDEDGLNNPAGDLALAVGTAPTVDVTVTNNSGSTATLYGWIDYNGDGVFSNATERATITVPDGTTASTVTLTFPDVPAGFTGTTYARFRLSTDGAAADPTGTASDGEVEDYVATIEQAGLGTVTTDFGLGNDFIRNGVLQADGKIVVVGCVSNGSNNDFGIARYNTNGTLDPTFGSAGMVTTDFAGSNDEGYDVAIQPDGKIVVAGVTNSGGDNNDFALARYNPDGSLDGSFGSGGQVVADVIGASEVGQAMVLQPDGKIVVAGSIGYSLVLARFNTDGTLDPTFGSGGTVTGSAPGASAMALHPDGRITVAGAVHSGSYNFSLARYNANGSPDNSFAANTDFFGGPDQISSIAIQPDGKIVAGGYAYSSAIGTDLALARYNSDGTLDSAFGSAGKVTTGLAANPRYDYIGGLALRPDGKIVVGGQTDTDVATGNNFVVAQYDVNGVLDPTFGTNGATITDFSAGEDVAYNMLLLPDGKVVAVGQTFNGTDSDFALARYNVDGNLDASFGDAANIDFGDAPSPYPTLLANNGARHLATGPTLGSNRDAEIDGQPDPNALGDDNNGTPDDEDGVTFGSIIVGSTQATNIEMVTIGNPGNIGELSGAGAGGTGPDRICGGVAYAYNIGKYEVTAGQYTEFLNSVAADDVHGLYNAEMWSNSYGCKIQQSGSPGSYSYSVAADWADRPVNYVDFWDAARFANWLHNGQGSGDTESGAYHDIGSQSLFGRNPGALFFIPTEDEWYKAAYHKNDGVTGNYFDGPINTDSSPSNDLVEPTDPGNNATFHYNGHTIGSPHYRTEVGAHENSESPYGTFDQGGNVFEWHETVVANVRGLRGGGFVSYHYSDHLQAKGRYLYYDPAHDDYDVGFRVASAVSQPNPRDASVTVNVQNAPSGAKLDAWMDFNIDGDWNDAGEQIFANQSVSAGSNALTFTIPAGALAGTSYARFRLSTAGGLSFVGSAADGEVEDYQVILVAPAVVGRHVFYNNSAWDGNGSGPSAADDAAIALDKQALLPGQTAAFVNYTSYSKGINGVMVDINGLVATPTAADFQFRVGNDDAPAGWPAGPAPQSITVRAGAGVGGSDRVTVIWADNDWHTTTPETGAIARQWLQVTVLATANTGLAAPDVFLFGNAVGESGNSSANAAIDATDEIGARNNPHWFLDPALVDDAYDYNRDKKVDATDQIIARNNQTFFLNDLNLIAVPAAGGSVSSVTAQVATPTALLGSRSQDSSALLATLSDGGAFLSSTRQDTANRQAAVPTTPVAAYDAVLEEELVAESESLSVAPFQAFWLYDFELTQESKRDDSSKKAVDLLFADDLLYPLLP